MHTSIRVFITSILYFACLTSLVYGQKSKKIDKNYFAIDIDMGFSFADFNESQSVWKPSLYPAFSLSLVGNKRINARLDFDYGVGGTFFYLINNGPRERYILDFASPYLIAGLGYSFLQTHRQEQYVKVSAIAQLGYDDTFREEFDTYTVDIVSDSRYYYSMKVQYGLRKFRKKSKRGKSKIAADEYGLFFRYSFQDLGTATFSGADYTTSISPKGHLGGFFYRMILSYGGGKVKRKVREREKPEKEIPPIIYNPRF